MSVAASVLSPRAKRYRPIQLATLGFLAFAVLWRTVRYLMRFPLWGDEAFLATSFFTRGYLGMVGSLEYSQLVPLGFMWCELFVTRLVGLTEMGLRLFPFLIGLASVWLYCGLAATLFGPRTAMLCSAVFAVSYFPMRYGVELKPYGLDLCVALVVLRLGFWMLSKPASVGRSLALIGAAAMGVWFSYPSAFVSGAVGLVLTYRLLHEFRRRAFWIWFGYGVCLLSSFFLMLHVQANPQSASWIHEMPMWNQAFPPLKDPVKLAWWLIDIHIGELLAYPVGGKHGGSVVPFLLCTIGSVALWRKNKEAFMLLLGPLLLTLIAAGMHRYPYGGGPRVSLYTAPAFCLLVGSGLAVTIRRMVSRPHRLRAITIAAGLLACIGAVGLGRDIIHPYVGRNDVQCRQALRDLAQRTGPADSWVIFNSLDESSYAPNLYLWGGTGATFRYYVTLLAAVRVQWAPRPEAVERRAPGRLWLLVYHDNKIAFPQRQFDAYLEMCNAQWGLPQRALHALGGAEAIEIFSFGDRPGAESRMTTRDGMKKGD